VFGDDGHAYAESLNTGADLVIPKERYLSRLADDHAELREIAGPSQTSPPSVSR
jgi:hypothetical protein